MLSHEKYLKTALRARFRFAYLFSFLNSTSVMDTTVTASMILIIGMVANPKLTTFADSQLATSGLFEQGIVSADSSRTYLRKWNE